MANRKPLVFVAGEVLELPNTDTINVNNATIIATGSTKERSLKELFSDILNVKNFGAIGDGERNDTAAFRAAVFASAERNAVIYVPDGIYKIDDQIEGNFISFGHPIFIGEGSISFLVDLFDDYVHKTKSITETITGNKTFSDPVNFNENVSFNNTITITGTQLLNLCDPEGGLTVNTDPSSPNYGKLKLKG